MIETDIVIVMILTRQNYSCATIGKNCFKNEMKFDVSEYENSK